MFDLSEIRLDPHNQSGGVDEFMAYYGIASRLPNIDFLRIILRYFSRLPYENISKIIKLNRHINSPGHPIRLPDEVMSDHAQFHLGGTCFSLTYFLHAILSRHGFDAYPVIAHMRNRPNVHCALVTMLEGSRILVDPGYLLNDPMEIHPDCPRIYHSSHAGVELVFERETEIYHLYTFDRLESKWRYCFADRPLSADEFLNFWLESFSAPTMHGICLTQLSPEGRVYLHNDYLQISSINGKQKRRIKENLQDVIQSIFGIDGGRVDEALSAVERNMEWERERGIYRPREKRQNETR